jgi:hypothetical protein
MLTSISKKNNENIKLNIGIDRYTKILLSIIAVCLLLIVLNMYFKAATLNALDTTQDVNLKYINGSSFSGSEIPVDIHSIKGSDIWNNEIPVDLKSVNGNFIFGSDVPVRVR